MQPSSPHWLEVTLPMSEQLTSGAGEVTFMEHGQKDSASGRAVGTHLTALTGADPIVVAWGFVLTDKARLVDAGEGRRRGRAGHYLFGTAALGLNGWREEGGRGS